MDDKRIAAIARALAEALAMHGYERKAETRADVARLQTELCAAVRAEIAEETVR